MSERRPVSYKEFDSAYKGYCLMFTGGMMSPPIALVERHDGTIARIPVEDIQFIDADGLKENADDER